jgi:hypothetical protein
VRVKSTSGSHGIGARALDAALARHATTCFVAIFKSGGTAETLMQTIAVLSALRDAGLQTRIPDIFLGITEPAIPRKANGLRDLLGKYHVPMLDHDPGVGGRYSAFTNVELLPAANWPRRRSSTRVSRPRARSGSDQKICAAGSGGGRCGAVRCTRRRRASRSA